VEGYRAWLGRARLLTISSGTRCADSGESASSRLMLNRSPRLVRSSIPRPSSPRTARASATSVTCHARGAVFTGRSRQPVMNGPAVDMSEGSSPVGDVVERTRGCASPVQLTVLLDSNPELAPFVLIGDDDDSFSIPPVEHEVLSTVS
jgi:hypothetical protein